MVIRRGLGLAVGEHGVILRYTVVSTRVEVADHDIALATRRIDRADRRIAIHAVGARIIATAHACGPDNYVLISE